MTEDNESETSDEEVEAYSKTNSKWNEMKRIEEDLMQRERKRMTMKMKQLNTKSKSFMVKSTIKENNRREIKRRENKKIEREEIHKEKEEIHYKHNEKEKTRKILERNNNMQKELQGFNLVMIKKNPQVYMYDTDIEDFDDDINDDDINDENYQLFHNLHEDDKQNNNVILMRKKTPLKRPRLSLNVVSSCICENKN